MFFLDRLHEKDGGDIYRVQSAFRYPLSKDKEGRYKVPGGSTLHVCLTSDFFLEDADPWRGEAWEIIRKRPDVKFFLLTKRPQRVRQSLPADWNGGWEHVMLNVSVENQRRADERVPILLSLPFKHKGVMCAPLIGTVSLRTYLDSGQIEQVICDGENYPGARPCHYEWVRSLRDECVRADVTFIFGGTGWRFVKDGRLYKIEKPGQAHEQARRSGLSYEGRSAVYNLADTQTSFPATLFNVEDVEDDDKA